LLTGSINAATEAEYEEPKDVTATTEEENSAQLLADFNKAQVAEKRTTRHKAQRSPQRTKILKMGKLSNLKLKAILGQIHKAQTRETRKSYPTGKPPFTIL
jgi:recombination protein RecT